MVCKAVRITKKYFLTDRNENSVSYITSIELPLDPGTFCYSTGMYAKQPADNNRSDQTVE